MDISEVVTSLAVADQETARPQPVEGIKPERPESKGICIRKSVLKTAAFILLVMILMGVEGFYFSHKTDSKGSILQHNFAEASSVNNENTEPENYWTDTIRDDDRKYMKIRLSEPLKKGSSLSFKEIIDDHLKQNNIAYVYGWHVAKIKDLMLEHYGIEMPKHYGNTRIAAFIYPAPGLKGSTILVFIIFPNGYVKRSSSLERLIDGMDFENDLIWADIEKDQNILAPKPRYGDDWRNGADAELEGLNIDLHSLPSVDYDVITTMKGDELLLTQASIDQGKWYYVSTSTGYMGWFKGKYYRSK